MLTTMNSNPRHKNLRLRFRDVKCIRNDDDEDSYEIYEPFAPTTMATRKIHDSSEDEFDLESEDDYYQYTLAESLGIRSFRNASWNQEEDELNLTALALENSSEFIFPSTDKVNDSKSSPGNLSGITSNNLKESQQTLPGSGDTMTGTIPEDLTGLGENSVLNSPTEHHSSSYYEHDVEDSQSDITVVHLLPLGAKGSGSQGHAKHKKTKLGRAHLMKYRLPQMKVPTQKTRRHSNPKNTNARVRSSEEIPTDLFLLKQINTSKFLDREWYLASEKSSYEILPANGEDTAVDKLPNGPQNQNISGAWDNSTSTTKTTGKRRDLPMFSGIRRKSPQVRQEEGNRDFNKGQFIKTRKKRKDKKRAIHSLLSPRGFHPLRGDAQPTFLDQRLNHSLLPHKSNETALPVDLNQTSPSTSVDRSLPDRNQAPPHGMGQMSSALDVYQSLPPEEQSPKFPTQDPDQTHSTTDPSPRSSLPEPSQGLDYDLSHESYPEGIGQTSFFPDQSQKSLSSEDGQTSPSSVPSLFTISPELDQIIISPDLGQMTLSPDDNQKISSRDLGQVPLSPDDNQKTSSPDLGQVSFYPDDYQMPFSPDLGQEPLYPDDYQTPFSPDQGQVPFAPDDNQKASPHELSLLPLPPEFDEPVFSQGLDQIPQSSEFSQVTLSPDFDEIILSPDLSQVTLSPDLIQTSPPLNHRHETASADPSRASNPSDSGQSLSLPELNQTLLHPDLIHPPSPSTSPQLNNTSKSTELNPLVVVGLSRVDGDDVEIISNEELESIDDDYTEDYYVSYNDPYKTDTRTDTNSSRNPDTIAAWYLRGHRGNKQYYFIAAEEISWDYSKFSQRFG